MNKKPEYYGITDYEWKKGKLNVFTDVDLSYQDLKGLPFNFGIINGKFNCSKNNLESLEGSPTETRGDFVCSNNKLTSLKYSPLKVYGFFWIRDNKLAILDGSHIEVTQGFAFSRNPIKEIISIPKCKKLITDIPKKKIDEMIRIGSNKANIRLKMNQL